MAVALPRPHPAIDSAPVAEPMDERIGEAALTLFARDGYPLAATLYERQDTAAAPADAVVFNGGGGIAVRRYRHFLRYLAARGLPVLAYDYRGVGASAPVRRRGFDAGIEDWSEFDQSAAIDFARHMFPSARLSSVSHSIGCLVAASSPNAALVEQMVFVAPHTGYWADYRQPWRWPMALVWHVFMPTVARAVGYFPASWFGLGDDFPRRMALQWAARKRASYHFGAYRGSASREFSLIDRMSALEGTALVVSSVGDAFATDRAIRRFAMGMPRVSLIRRDASDAGTFRHPAHLAFFRRKSAHDWRTVADFLGSRVRRYQLAPDWTASSPASDARGPEDSSPAATM